MLNDKLIGCIENGVYKITADGTWALDVPEFTGGEYDGVYSSGDNSFIVCLNNVNKGDITDYLNTLQNIGYTKVFENQMGENDFYSYKNDKNIIYLYYIKAMGTAKVVAEPYYEFTYNVPFENKVKPAVITSSACDRNYYILLPNNTIVVIDGGWRVEDWSQSTPEALILSMYKEMAEICGGETVNVPLWIITHAHSDHGKVIEYLHKMPYADKFKIDRILYNFPDSYLLGKEEVTTSEKIDARINEWHQNAGIEFPYEDIFYNCPFPVPSTVSYEKVMREAFTHYDAVKIKAHDGMRFDLSGVVFEVLHTPDDDMPTHYNNMNDTSLVIKMTYEGCATLWLGDMGVLPGDSCIEMYGDYLKCDAVQVSHHGWGSASWEFFKLLNPSILLWNNSEFGFQYADKYQGYGKTESSTRLFNMPCVKQNYFCNTIKMQYIDLPFEFSDNEDEKAENKLLVSAASDRTFMLKLGDGKLIMINGGWRTEAWNRYNHDDLMKKLFGEMQYFAGSDTVTVAAYIMTDEENDNQFLYNLNSADFRNKVKIENIISASNGNDFYFGEAKIKIIYANNKKIVVKITIGGKEIIFTGNMTDEISKEILQSGQPLKCDIVQIANHGYNDCGVLEFYENTNAKIGIWNTSEYAFRFFNKNEGYGKSEVSTKVYNLEGFEKHYFCDRILPQIIPLF